MHGEQLLKLGHRSMLIAVLLSLSAAYIAYGLEAKTPIGWQILSHLLLLLLPGVFKIGYVMRLTGLKQLGRAVD